MTERYRFNSLNSWHTECGRFVVARNLWEGGWRLVLSDPSHFDHVSEFHESGLLEPEARWSTRSELLSALGEVCRAIGEPPPGRVRRNRSGWITEDGTVSLRRDSDDRGWTAAARMPTEGSRPRSESRVRSGFPSRAAATRWARSVQAEEGASP